MLNKFLTLIMVGSVMAGSYVQGQNLPVAYTMPSPVAGTLPAAYNMTRINLVRTWVPQTPSTDSAFVKSASRTPAEVIVNTIFFDGRGRQLQQVTKGVSWNAKDVVKPTIYDAQGRVRVDYMPYAPYTGVAANMTNGKFKTDPFQKQWDYYANAALNPGAGENNYFSENEYENSPLGRILRSWQPGVYAKGAGSKFKKFSYLTNTVADSVRIWTYAAGAALPTSASGKIYGDSMLFKTVVFNEAGNQTIEYTDKEGHVVLKKVQLNASPGTGHVGWACTYFIYNKLGLPTLIISPKAVEVMNPSWSLTAAIAAELCFQNKYDQKNRLVKKQMAGGDSLEYVYDQRSRLIGYRNGTMRSRTLWEATYYDAMDRPVKKTTFAFAYNRDQMQAYHNSYPFNPLTSFPGLDTAAMTTMAYYYYDHYDYPGVVAYSTTDIAKVLPGSNPNSEPLPATPSLNTIGIMTGQKVRVIGSVPAQWLTTWNYYNSKGRLIQSVTDNFAGGKNTINYLYDFAGKVLSTYLRVTDPKSTATPQITVATYNIYTATGLLDSVKKRINDVVAETQTIAVMKYDDMGKLIQKRLRPQGSSQLEYFNFDYDLRGKMFGINREYVNTPGSTENRFGQQLYFENSFTNVYYDGNVAGAKWKSASDGVCRAYGYNYDRMKRLTEADFNQQNEGTSTWTKDQVDFSANMAYDIGGSMVSMKQRGMNGVAIQTIDSLKYSYLPASYQLNWVTDKRNNTASILGDFTEAVNTETQDYNYDLEGNVSKDKNQDIDTILFDHLNMPSYMKVKNRGEIYFTYDAAGNKLAKVVIDTTGGRGSTITTSYLAGLIFERTDLGADTLLSISHEEGRIRPVYKTGQAVKFVYDYFASDIHGNVRMVYSGATDTAVYANTNESALRAKENLLFSNVDATATNVKPSGYPVDNTTSPNDFIAKTNGSGQKNGPSLVLRVMPGDTVYAMVNAFYTSTAANTSNNTVSQMLTALLASFATGGISEGVHFSSGPGSPVSSLTSPVYQILRDKDANQNQSLKPKAYLSYVMFDDRFKVVDDNSGVRQVQGSPNAMTLVTLPKMVIKKAGFIYLYLNNESNSDVFFDNFQVVHLSGPVLEETHYYPFGLTMAGISSCALKGSAYYENNFKLSGKELQTKEFRTGGSLNMYDFGARRYNQKIGMWHAVDPKADQMSAYSPYNYCFDNPVSFIDPDGMAPSDIILKGAEAQKAFEQLQKAVKGKMKVSMDAEGKLSYSDAGKKQTIASRQLMQAIDDHSIQVNVNADNTKKIDNKVYVGGALVATEPGKTKTDPVNTYQQVNPGVLGDVDEFYGKRGAGMLHEVVESYLAGIFSQETGVYYGRGNKTPKILYNAAHNTAPKQAGVIVESLFSPMKTRVYDIREAASAIWQVETLKPEYKFKTIQTLP